MPGKQIKAVAMNSGGNKIVLDLASTDIPNRSEPTACLQPEKNSSNRPAVVASRNECSENPLSINASAAGYRVNIAPASKADSA